MTQDLRVSIGQSPGALLGRKARLNWLSDALTTQESDLFVLPELFQCGYDIGEQVARRAEPMDGAFAGEIAILAKRHQTAILYGYAERVGDTLFNSAICVDKSGEIIGHHRKLLLPPGFEGDHFARGDTCQPFDLSGFKIAILICYDAEFAENMRHVALMGAELVVVPTALASNWGVVSQKLIPTRAFENGVYVAYANHAGEEGATTYFGGSCIHAPDGQECARAGPGPGIISARLPHDLVVKAQKRLPYLSNRQNLPWVGG